MDYSKVYDAIVERARGRNWKSSRWKIGEVEVPTGTYVEVHHIVPKCMGGNNKKQNLVVLTTKEHYICHVLLFKTHPDNKKLASAMYAMRDHVKKELYTVRLRELLSKNSSALWSKGEYRNKTKASHKKYWDNVENRKKLSERLKKEYLDPAVVLKRTKHFKNPKSSKHKKKIGEKTRARMNRPEMKKKYRDRYKISSFNNSRKVIDLNTKVIYDSACEAAKRIGKKYEVVKKWLYLKIPKHGLMWLDHYTNLEDAKNETNVG